MSSKLLSMKRFVLAFVVLTTLLCGYSAAEKHQIGTKNYNAQLEKLLEVQIKCLGLPGAYAHFVQSEQASGTAATGNSDINPQRDMKPDDLFRVGSVSKTFTATVVLSLADKGKINLDDKMHKYIAEDDWKAWVSDFKQEGDKEKLENLTVTQILQHSSCLYDYNGANFTPDTFVCSPDDTLTPIQLLNYLGENAFTLYMDKNKTQKCEIGKSFHYSNTNYILLGMMAEQASGQPFHKLVKRHIAKPLGIQETTYFPKGNGFRSTLHTEGYIGSGYYNAITCPNGPKPELPEEGGKRQLSKYSPSFAWSAGAVISNLPDLEVWVSHLISGKKLYSEAMAKRRIDDRVFGSLGGIPMYYGLGLMELVNAEKKVTTLGHGGLITGYSTAIWYRVNEDTYIVANANTFSGETPDVSGNKCLGGDCAAHLFLNIEQLLFGKDHASVPASVIAPCQVCDKVTCGILTQ